ncbi:unnamed protein product [Psylliodes chrysocephalus]|uniref:Uncharacterized protein n=1 Tax=Psylliodes chrysocephalus TaxID=3402493 RepID=A0A9P0CJP4_9CUCU|nr:unnamed protein product [Psylliodes chrysocephala]
MNKIRSNSLNFQLFAQPCEENDEVFILLFLRTEVFEYVLQFLQEKDPNLKEKYLQFSHLSILPEMLQDDVILSYMTHLEALHKNFTKRFENLLNLQTPQWIKNPYNTTAIEEANLIMQEELIIISTDEELKQKFNQGYQKFWLRLNIETQYHVL